jgi:hypothetical protein
MYNGRRHVWDLACDAVTGLSVAGGECLRINLCCNRQEDWSVAMSDRLGDA